MAGKIRGAPDRANAPARIFLSFVSVVKCIFDLGVVGSNSVQIKDSLSTESVRNNGGDNFNEEIPGYIAPTLEGGWWVSRT
ncbi:hypothetical protein ACP70R_039553 [Stipagrostis hirtigluma subsp. patula]